MIGAMFGGVSLVCVATIVVGVVAVVAKKNEDGKAWFKEKFGEKWEEKIFIRFLGWPMVAIGALMILPGKDIVDLLFLALGLGAYFGYNLWQKQKVFKAKAEKENAEKAPQTSV